MLNPNRTHDAFYQFENDLEPKQYFTSIGDLIEKYRERKNFPLRIADIGCAAGAFPAYLANRFPNDYIHGYEYLPELVDSARNKYPTINFSQASVIDNLALPEHYFDVITICGVHSIFDNFEQVLDNLLLWIKSDSKIFIHGLFNPFPYDVFVKYKNNTGTQTELLESGWNMPSQLAVANLLKMRGKSNFVFHEFRMKKDIPKNQNDLLRSWTINDSNNIRHITNGLSLLQPHYTLEVTT